jgi:hypothetical protein
MGRAFANTIIALFGVVIVLALFPNKTTTRYSARAANWITDRMIAAAYAVADAIADRRARRRARRHPQTDQPTDRQEHKSEQQQPERDPAPDPAAPPPWAS